MTDKLEEYLLEVKKKGHVMENGTFVFDDGETWTYKVKKLKRVTK